LNEKSCLKRISKGQTAVFAYPSAFSAAKVRVLVGNLQFLFKKVSGFGFQVSGFRFRVSGFRLCFALGIEKQTLNGTGIYPTHT
jgi:hypothetical protein